MVAFVSATSLARGQNHEGKKEGLTHIKLVKEKNGERTELDTLIEPGAVFVWQGDTVGKPAIWISKGKNSSEEGTFTYDMKSDEEGIQKVMVIKHSNDADAPKGKGAAFWVSSDGARFDMGGPEVPPVLTIHGERGVDVRGGNVIDLSDPGIVSYKRKKMSGGREKIQIIRNLKETSDLTPVPVIGHHIPAPPIVKKDRIIMKGENGVFHISDGEGEIIKSADGKNVYTIKTIKEGEGDIINIEEVEMGDGKHIKVIVNDNKQKAKQETENKEDGN
jgi:hypothetical protein